MSHRHRKGRSGPLTRSAAAPAAAGVQSVIGAMAAQVLEIFRKLCDETGRAIVIVTHDMELAARADRQVRIVDGRIASPGPAGPSP